MNTTERNKLIAEFMGYKFYEHLPLKRNGWQLESNKDTAIYLTHSDEDLKYHNSWDWLMPVVEKIENLGANVLIGRMFCEIKYTNPLNEGEIFEKKIVSGIKINAVNGSVVEFIKWYNENK